MTGDRPNVGMSDTLRERLNVILAERQHRRLYRNTADQLNLLGCIYPGSHLKGTF